MGLSGVENLVLAYHSEYGKGQNEENSKLYLNKAVEWLKSYVKD